MKGTTTWRSGLMLAICAVLMAGVLVLAGCPSDSDDSGGTGTGGGGTFPAAKGKLTITDIPSEHNDKYIWLSGTVGSTALLGLTDITGYGTTDPAYKMVKIAGGKAEVPLYYLNASGTTYADAYKAYDGNDSITALIVMIIADTDGSLTTSEMTSTASAISKTITSGKFSSGSYTYKWQ